MIRADKDWIVIDAGNGEIVKIMNGHITLHPYSMDRKTVRKTIRGIENELKNYEKAFTAYYGFLSRTSEKIYFVSN